MVYPGLYARVSMDESSEDRRYQEPENQLEPLRQFARTQGWPEWTEYVDKVSGGDSNRPEFRRMLNDAMQRKIDVIVIWKLDRFSREGLSQTFAYISKLRQRKVGVISVTESWLDTREDNPTADLLLAIFSWVAAEERRHISQRTKAGIAQRRALGNWKGGRPRKCVSCGAKVQHKENNNHKCDKCKLADEQTNFAALNLSKKEPPKTCEENTAKDKSPVFTLDEA